MPLHAAATPASGPSRSRRYTTLTFRTAQAAVTVALLISKGLDGGSAHDVPSGYIYKGMVEFTESPHHQRPHAFLDDGAFDSTQHASTEGDLLETLLVTPDGRMYTKPVSESLEYLQSSLRQSALPAQGEAGARGGASRRLAQVGRVAAPSASIGVSTSSDLSCNGCGPDNRIQITATTTYPFMTVGQLIGQLGTSSVGLECTGTLIGNSHVLTAAHCVFDINASRRMVANLNFAPAMSGSRTPYGTLAWTQARILSQFSSQPSYTTTAMNYDYALVTLANPATSGYLSLFFPPSNGTTENASLTTAGYPGSKPSGTMWSSACGNTPIDYSSNNAFANVQQCTSGRCANILTHTCISSDGQSGSGMWDSDYKIRSILTGKVTVSNGDAYNVATEINVAVYNQLAAWYNEDKDTAGNGTLPLAPSGPGSQPSNQNAFIRWWNENWGKSWFIAVVIVVCVTIAGILLMVFVQILRCCGCCGSTPQPAKIPNGAYQGNAPRPFTSRAPSSPAYPQPAPSAPQAYYPYR